MSPRSLKDEPFPVQVVTHYANAAPTPPSWRKEVLEPFFGDVLQPADEPRSGPVLGVDSFEQLLETLAEFRSVVRRWAALQPGDSREEAELLRILNERSRLRVKRYVRDSADGLIVPQLETENASFTEMLYSFLLLTLQKVPPRCIHRCVACDRLFFVLSHKNAIYCSPRCRNRETTRRYRARRRLRPAQGQRAPKES